MTLTRRTLLLGVCGVWASAHCLFAQCPDGTPPPCGPRVVAPPTLVVVPFENRSRDTSDAYLAVTLTEDLTSSLGASHRLRLRSPRSGRQAADYAVAGSVRRTGTMVRITAQLSRPTSGEIVWTTTLDRALAQSDVAVEELAREVLRRTGVGSSAANTVRHAVDPEAYDAYLRGRYHGTRRTEAEIAQAVGLFRQATARDPTFALAWAGLANTLAEAARWRLPVPGVPAESVVTLELDAAQRALLSDSTQADIWVIRARVAEDVDPTSRTASLRAVRRALALDSLSANAWNYLGFALMDVGDTAAAIAAARRAVAIDPAKLEALITVGLQHYWLRRYDSAAVWADSAIATDPTFLSGHRLAGTIALARGRLSDAEAQFSAARTIGPGPERIWAIAGLACVAVARGDTAAARTLVAEAVTLTDSLRPALHSAVFLAWGYAALGQRERALDWLERYRPRGDLHFRTHLRGDAPLDPLRGELRFRALVERR